jgi:hypothetical protein
MELYAEVDVESSKWNTKGRNIILNIAKKEEGDEKWTRLTKDKAKNHHINVSN